MDMCTREHVKAGLLHLDPDMADHVVWTPSLSLLTNAYVTSQLSPAHKSRFEMSSGYAGPIRDSHKCIEMLVTLYTHPQS